MPIADTPFAHDVVAVATNWTVVATSLLGAGAFTVTPANAEHTLSSAKTNPNNLIEKAPFWVICNGVQRRQCLLVAAILGVQSGKSQQRMEKQLLEGSKTYGYLLNRCLQVLGREAGADQQCCGRLTPDMDGSQERTLEVHHER
jgi:hypothetical protein